MKIRKAVKQDAKDLAYLINLAGEGLPEYLWQTACSEGEDPLELGTNRAAREEGGFSYTNATICHQDNTVMGMVLSYQQPDPYDIDNLNDYPAVVRPLIELEALAPGSWYINAIATYEAYQGKGVARRLFSVCDDYAKDAGCSEISLIVASENTRAKRLYEHLGFHRIQSRPVVSYEGCIHGGDWLLMLKQL